MCDLAILNENVPLLQARIREKDIMNELLKQELANALKNTCKKMNDSTNDKQRELDAYRDKLMITYKKNQQVVAMIKAKNIEIANKEQELITREKQIIEQEKRLAEMDIKMKEMQMYNQRQKAKIDVKIAAYNEMTRAMSQRESEMTKREEKLEKDLEELKSNQQELTKDIIEVEMSKTYNMTDDQLFEGSQMCQYELDMKKDLSEEEREQITARKENFLKELEERGLHNPKRKRQNEDDMNLEGLRLANLDRLDAKISKKLRKR